MILPNNGKVIIIDDVPEDVKPLMAALKKEKMPFLFFQDQGGDDLPEDGPIENVRLVFLDLDLGLGDGTDEMAKIRVVQSRIVRLIEKNNPYILVIWSTHEDRLKNLLLKEFNEGFKDYKPLAHCSLDKSIIHKHEIKVMEAVRTELKSKLSSFSAFNPFLLWESSINDATGSITNKFTNIFERNEGWDKNFSALLYSLSEANSGTDVVGELSDEEKLCSAFEIINSTLIETIESYFYKKLEKIVFPEIKKGGIDIQEGEKNKINSSLHIYAAKDLPHFFSGNLYIKNNCDLVKDIIKYNFKEAKGKEIIESNPLLAALDVTPSCDYSQRKNYTRILYGVIINAKYFMDKPGREILYKDCPIILLDAPSYILFDYRHFMSYSKPVFGKIFAKRPVYRLRNSILLDIQAKLSNHLNRPGIITLK